MEKKSLLQEVSFASSTDDSSTQDTNTNSSPPKPKPRSSTSLSASRSTSTSQKHYTDTFTSSKTETPNVYTYSDTFSSAKENEDEDEATITTNRIYRTNTFESDSDSSSSRSRRSSISSSTSRRTEDDYSKDFEDYSGSGGLTVTSQTQQHYTDTFENTDDLTVRSVSTTADDDDQQKVIKRLVRRLHLAETPGANRGEPSNRELYIHPHLRHTRFGTGALWTVLADGEAATTSDREQMCARGLVEKLQERRHGFLQRRRRTLLRQTTVEEVTVEDVGLSELMVTRLRLHTLMQQIKRARRQRIHDPTKCANCVHQSQSLRQYMWLREQCVRLSNEVIERRLAEPDTAKHRHMLDVADLAKTTQRKLNEIFTKSGSLPINALLVQNIEVAQEQSKDIHS